MSEIVFCRFPTNKKDEYVEIAAEKIAEWEESYPAVDVRQEIRNARQWCIDNPQRRKTKTGMNRFINAWLSRVQNRGIMVNTMINPVQRGYSNYNKTNNDVPIRAPYLPQETRKCPEWFNRLNLDDTFHYQGKKYRKVTDTMFETIEGAYKVGNASSLR